MPILKSMIPFADMSVDGLEWRLAFADGNWTHAMRQMNKDNWSLFVFERSRMLEEILGRSEL